MTRLSLTALLQSPRQVVRNLTQMSALARSRKALLGLDDHLLRDIGLTRHEADAEALARQPLWGGLWDAPAHWRTAKTGPEACAFPAGGA